MKMLKFCFAILFFTFFCTTALAKGADWQSLDSNTSYNNDLRGGGPEVAAAVPDYSGVYVGADIGMSDADFKLSTYEGGFQGPGEVSQSAKLTPMAAAYGVDFGYGWQLSHFYIGAYITAQYSNLFRNADSNSFFGGGFTFQHFNSAALRFTYGFGIKPGILLSPRTLLFANLALVEGRFSFNSVYQRGPSFGISPPLTNSVRKTIGAWQFGMGIENHPHK